jgi:peptide/nickel transport system substrate-binding protein
VPARAEDADQSTLRIALSSSPNNLNPILTTQVIEAFIDSIACDGLIVSTPDGAIVPLLAATVPTQQNGGISRDGRTITYKLRHGVRWHDGAPFTSHDVAFTQRQILNPQNNVTVRDPYRSVAKLDTPDDYTVVVHLSQAYSPFVAEWFASRTTAILPEHLLGKYPELNDVPYNAAPVGTGPFIFDHWDRGREIVYRANDAYFLGKPKLRRIVVQLMADENSRTVALQSGETDWSYIAASTSARLVAGKPDIATRLLAANAYAGMIVQTTRPPLDDKRLRRALAFALDRPSMVAKISGDFVIPASADIGPYDWAYDPTVKPLPFDVEQSRKLLAEAGWKPGASGILERDGKPLAFVLVFAAGQTATQAYAVQIQAMLRVVGIDVTIKPVQANILFAPLGEHGTLSSGDFDLALAGFFNFADPNDRRSFACSSIPPNGFNDNRWCNADYDRVTNDALLHVDRATRKKDYKRASEILIEEAPEIFLYWYKQIQLVRDGVHIDDGTNLLPVYLWSKAYHALAGTEVRREKVGRALKAVEFVRVDRVFVQLVGHGV